jgi:hypothetical protein
MYPYSPIPTLYPPFGFGQVPKPPNNKLVVGLLIGTVVFILIIVIVDVVMYTSKKGLFSPYTPPVPPANTVSPNGNPTVKSINPIPTGVKSITNSNLGTYGNTSPGLDSIQFGAKTTA